ncbi:MAG: acylphosphatase [Treponema sp.]|nr:acylphosphatase [Treponema sp.]
MIRLQLRFTGRVQGVGFRWTARNIADSLGLTGWVMNDYDGTVLMEVQGRKETIQKMIEGLEHGTFIEIERIEREQIPLVEYERSFKIKDE